MEKTYSPLVLPGWSETPTANQGHINDYLPGNRYGEDWAKAEEHNDFISLFTVHDEEGINYYKVLYTKEPDSPVYVRWMIQDQRFGYDEIDRFQAEAEILKIQARLDAELAARD